MEEVVPPSKAVEEVSQKHGFTLRHFVHVFVINGVGAAILNGGINFGLATAMYKGTSQPITTWALPNSLAGDSIVTIMIQGTLTWIIAGLLTRKDVEGGRIAPLPWCPPPLLWIVHYFFFEGDFDFIARGFPSRIMRLFFTVLRGIVFAGAVAIFLWPISIIYPLVEFGNSGLVPDWPTPQIYKAVLAAVLALLTTPPVALLALMEGHRFLLQSQVEPLPVANSTSGLLKLQSYASTQSERLAGQPDVERGGNSSQVMPIK